MWRVATPFAMPLTMYRIQDPARRQGTVRNSGFAGIYFLRSVEGSGCSLIMN